MKNKRKEVSSSDDSEIIDDPNPIPLVESTRLEKSVIERRDSFQKKNKKGSEAISTDSNDHLKSGRNTVDSLIQNKCDSSIGVNDKSQKKSLGNDSTDVQATFDVKELSQDDEVYIFHCPENFKKQEFLNQIINISKSKQFLYSKDGEKYQLDIFNLENKQITLAVPQKSVEGKLFNLPLKGHMVFQKVIEMESYEINDINEFEDAVLFPNDIKLRHPFLGVNWKSYIDSAKEAIEKNKKIKRKIKTEKTEPFNDVKKRKIKDSSEVVSPKKCKKKIEC